MKREEKGKFGMENWYGKSFPGRISKSSLVDWIARKRKTFLSFLNVRATVDPDFLFIWFLKKKLINFRLWRAISKEKTFHRTTTTIILRPVFCWLWKKSENNIIVLSSSLRGFIWNYFTERRCRWKLCVHCGSVFVAFSRLQSGCFCWFFVCDSFSLVSFLIIATILQFNFTVKL